MQLVAIAVLIVDAAILPSFLVLLRHLRGGIDHRVDDIDQKQ